MGVMEIQSGQYVETAASSSVRGTRGTSGGGQSASSFEKDLDKALADGQPEEGAKSDAARVEEEQYPLEAYRIPNWYGDLMGGFNEVSCTLGASWEEAQTKYARLSRPDQKLYDEYANLLTTHYHEACAETGVSSDIGEYYHNFLQNPAKQAETRNALYSRLAEDPRALELMKHFGITI